MSILFEENEYIYFGRQTLEELEASLIKAERSMNTLKLKLADECQVLRLIWSHSFIFVIYT